MSKITQGARPDWMSRDDWKKYKATNHSRLGVERMLSRMAELDADAFKALLAEFGVLDVSQIADADLDAIGDKVLQFLRERNLA